MASRCHFARKLVCGAGGDRCDAGGEGRDEEFQEKNLRVRKTDQGGVALALALVVVASAGAAELAPRTAWAAEARATAGNVEVTGEANSYS